MFRIGKRMKERTRDATRRGGLRMKIKSHFFPTVSTSEIFLVTIRIDRNVTALFPDSVLEAAASERSGLERNIIVTVCV